MRRMSVCRKDGEQVEYVEGQECVGGGGCYGAEGVTGAEADLFDGGGG